MNTYINDIERYLNRQMNNAEMHAFEQAMMNDPFLAEAFDGYRAQWKNIQLPDDLSQLQQQLAVKEKKGRVVTGSFRQWMSIAASLIVLLSVSVVLYRIFSAEKTGSSKIVTQQKEQAPVAAKEVQPATVVDSQTVAINDKEVPVIKPSLPAVSQEPTEKKKSGEDIQSSASSAGTEKITAETAPTVKQAPAAIKTEVPAKKDNMNVAMNDRLPESKLPHLYKFSGQVVDENNNPLPFANIKEPLSGVGTYADLNGNFTLVSADSILSVETKSVGYGNAVNRLLTNREQKIVLKDEAVIANAPSKESLYERSKNRIPSMKTEVNDMGSSEPESGWGFYNIYIANNLREPEIDEKKSSAGRLKEIQVSFDVNPDGTVANLKIEKSNCKSCNQEAIRVIKEGPRWKSKTGKKERTLFTIQF